MNRSELNALDKSENRVKLFSISNDNFFIKLKLRMEMGNVPKRQQPDHRKKTAEGNQQVFNVAKYSRTQRRPSAGP